MINNEIVIILDETLLIGLMKGKQIRYRQGSNEVRIIPPNKEISITMEEYQELKRLYMHYFPITHTSHILNEIEERNNINIIF